MDKRADNPIHHTAPAITREALEWFDQLLELDDAARQQELDSLAQQRPELYPQVVALVESGRCAEAEGFLESGPPLASDEPDTLLRAGQTLGVYRVERELGVGGMGEVWLGVRTDGRYEGQVAIKVVHSLHALLPRIAVRERFVREGRLLGRLSHPNIARLLDAGVTPERVPYLVLEYVDGTRIDHWCEQHALDVRARLRLFLQACDAVAHAHTRLVVHRDLKPSNMLVTEDGTVKLLDFGIAKLLENSGAEAEATELTRLSGRALTPEYAAPEQIRGEPVTTATDVYSLGVLLFHMLAGRTPYRNTVRTAGELEREVTQTDPLRLSQAAPPERRKTLRGDLDNIVAQALRKDPAQRYPSVQAFADDIGNFLALRPVSARPDSLGYRAQRFIQRNRVAVGAGTVVVLALVAGLVATLWQAHRAEAAATRAMTEAARLARVQGFLYQALDHGNPINAGDPALSMTQLVDETLRRVESEFGDDPELQARLLGDFANMMIERIDFPRAQRLLDRALAIAGGSLSGDPEMTSRLYRELSVLRQFQGRLEAASQYAQQAVDLVRPLQKERPELYYGALDDQTAVWARQGRVSEGAPQAEKVLTFVRAIPDVSRNALIFTVARLGEYRLLQNRFNEAEALLKEAVALAEAEYGPEGTHRILGLMGLARVAYAQSDPARATRIADEVLAIARRDFGKIGRDNFYLAQAIYGAGLAQSQDRRLSEGEALLREAIAMQERLGDELVAVSYVTLVENLQGQGRSVDAMAAADRALAFCMRLPRDSFQACAELHAIRGALLARSGERARAIEELQVASDPGLDAYVPSRATVLAARAEIEAAIGRGEQALADQRRARDLLATIYGPEHVETRAAQDRLAQLSGA